MKHWLKICLSQLILTLFVGIIMLTLYVGAGRQYFPYISHLKPDLITYLSQQIKQPVDIEKLTGTWSGLLPIVEIHNLKIGHTDAPINIGYVKAKLDISASLFYLRPVFKQLSISQVSANIKELENKKWQLTPNWIMDFSQPVATNDNDWLSLIIKQRELLFLNWHIQHQQLDGRTEKIELDHLIWRNNSQQHSLSGKAKWGYKALHPIDFKANLTGSLWPYNAPDGRFFVQVAQQDWSRWIPNIQNPDIIFDQFNVSAKAWFRLEKGQLKSHYAIINSNNILLKTAGKPLNIPQGQLILAGLGDEQGWYSVIDSQFPNVKKWPKLRLYYHQLAPAQHALSLEIEKVSINRISDALRTHKLLPNQVQNYLEGLQPKGTIKKLGAAYIYQENTPPLALINVNLQEVSSKTYRGIPGFAGVSGKLVILPDSGYFIIKDSLASIYIDEVYHHFLNIKQPKGQFAWQLNEDSADLMLKQFSGSIKNNKATADMRLNIPYQQDKNLNMALKIGINTASLALHKQLVPEEFVDNSTRKWLDNAILAGQGQDFKFILNGDIGPKSRMAERTLLLDFAIQDGRLRYQQGFPDIQHIHGRFDLRDDQIHVRIQQAQATGLKLTKTATLHLNAAHPKYTTLNLNANIQGDLAPSFAYLTDTPLKAEIDNQLQGWFMRGQHKSKIQLGLHIGSHKSKPKFQLNSDINNADLYIKPLDLSLNKLQGHLQFDLQNGLQSKKIQAQVLGGLGQFQIQSKAKNNGFDMHIKGTGQANWKQLHQWQDNSFKPIINGITDYQLDAHIDLTPAQKHFVRLNSKLQGTQIKLPEPYGKKATEAAPLNLYWHSKQQQSWLKLDYKKQVSAALQWQNNNLKSGRIRIDGYPAEFSNLDGLFIYGNIAQPVELDKWYQMWQTLAANTNQKAQSNSIVRQFKFNFNHLTAFGINLGSSFFAGTKLANGWEIDLANRLSKGQIIINKSPTPISVKLDYLHINGFKNNTSEQSKDTPDILADFNPKQLPDIDLWLAELYYNTRNLGHWQIKMQRKPEGYLINVAQGKIKKLDVQAQLLWSKQNAQAHTEVKRFHLSTSNLADTYRAFRLVPIVENDEFNLSATANWLGSPANLQLKNLNSRIKYNLKKGRIDIKEAESLRGFGMLNVGAISRRLRLDFSDLYQSGLSFDEINAELKTEKGILQIQKPILIEGPSGKYQLSGSSNLLTETLDMNMAVTLPVSGSLPLFIVLAGLSPQVAGAVYITERLIGNEIETFTSASYHIHGTWDKPELKLNKVFDNKVEGTEAPSFIDRVKSIFWLD